MTARRIVRDGARIVVLTKTGTYSHPGSANSELRGAWDGKPGGVALVRLDDGRDVLVSTLDLTEQEAPPDTQRDVTQWLEEEAVSA